ncbi:AbiH family protein [Peptoanaerobacter stomatis]|uniref:AbiH family protein n=1 Tax=Peptoanaerobacter stomatis TaxID=796937 RepID=UPI003F9F8552
MNILVIGNGFDLAHGLPTKYGDFLDFIEYKKAIDRYVDNKENSINKGVYIELGNKNKIYFFEYEKYNKDKKNNEDGDKLTYEERYECIKSAKITGIDINKLLLIMEYTEHGESFNKLYKSLKQERKKELIKSLYKKEITDEEIDEVIKYIENNKVNFNCYRSNNDVDENDVDENDVDKENIIKSVTLEFYNIVNNINNREYINFIYFSKWISENEDEKMKFNLFRCNKYKKVYNENKENENFKIFDTYVNNNFWIEHFLEIRAKKREIGEGWIDFEQEIGKLLEKLEYNSNYFYWIFIRVYLYYIRIHRINSNSNDILSNLNYLKGRSPSNEDDIVYLFDIQFSHNNRKLNDIIFWRDTYNNTIDEIVKNLIKDLNNLIMAFEIYLKEVIQTMHIQHKNTNIVDIGKIDKIISFNYTNTFSRFYCNNVEVNYVHGKVRENLNCETNNIVLGIDEYLPEETKNTNLTFIYFKKYFQRIFKKNGAKYKEWLEETKMYGNDDGKEGIDYYIDKNLKMEFNNVYFFGHSLAASDRDILSEIIESKCTKVKIFYHDIKSYGEQIQNLIKIIGQDKLLEYTYRENKKIEFIEQK